MKQIKVTKQQDYDMRLGLQNLLLKQESVYDALANDKPYSKIKILESLRDEARIDFNNLFEVTDE